MRILTLLLAAVLVCGCILSPEEETSTTSSVPLTTLAPRSPSNNPMFSDCNLISDPQNRSLCYKPLILKVDKMSLCADIEDDEILGSCYFALAARNADLSACDKIPNPQMRLSCIDNVKKILSELT